MATRVTGHRWAAALLCVCGWPRCLPVPSGLVALQRQRAAATCAAAARNTASVDEPDVARFLAALTPTLRKPAQTAVQRLEPPTALPPGSLAPATAPLPPPCSRPCPCPRLPPSRRPAARTARPRACVASPGPCHRPPTKQRSQTGPRRYFSLRQPRARSLEILFTALADLRAKAASPEDRTPLDELARLAVAAQAAQGARPRAANQRKRRAPNLPLAELQRRAIDAPAAAAAPADAPGASLRDGTQQAPPLPPAEAHSLTIDATAAAAPAADAPAASSRDGALKPMSAEQRAIVEDVSAGLNVWVEAVAGSGKTTTALHIAQQARTCCTC